MKKVSPAAAALRSAPSGASRQSASQRPRAGGPASSSVRVLRTAVLTNACTILSSPEANTMCEVHLESSSSRFLFMGLG